MKLLHILKTEPDESVQKLCDCISKEVAASVIALYEGKVDWPAVVDEVFAHDKVICWW